MNLKETGLFIIISLLAVTACILYTEYYSVPLSAGYDEGKTITTPYVYPVTPANLEAWAKLTPQERQEACQIPEEILENMTIDALLETILEYPRMMTTRIYSSQSAADGALEREMERCNSLTELLARDGLAEALTAKYAATAPYERTRLLKMAIIMLKVERLELADDAALEDMRAAAYEKYLEMDPLEGDVPGPKMKIYPHDGYLYDDPDPSARLYISDGYVFPAKDLSGKLYFVPDVSPHPTNR